MKVDQNHPGLKQQKAAWDMICHHFGPVMQLLNPDHTEIMINADGKVWVDSLTEGTFCTSLTLSVEARRAIIQTVATSTNQRCNEELPFLSATLPVVGYRMAGLVEPAVEAPSIVIRIPSQKIFTLKEYVAQGTVSQNQARLLLQAIKNRHNILVAGGTGSGKTTFSNALLDVMQHTKHRIMTIEDEPELRCTAPNHIGVRINRDTTFSYTEALQMALRMKPDRIVVGELRDGAAALGLLKSWNTGHGGGLATLHADNAKSTLDRLEQLLQEAVPFTPKNLISQAIDWVAFIERYTRRDDGKRYWRVQDLARVQDDLDLTHQTYVMTHHYHPSCPQGGHE